MELRCGGSGRRGQEESGEVVGDDGTRARGQSAEQALPRAVLRLDILIGRDGALGEVSPVVGHAIEDEPVEAIRGPRVVDAQRFEDDERLAELMRPFQRALHCEVVARAPERSHPVQDVIPIGATRFFMDAADAQRGDRRERQWDTASTHVAMRSRSCTADSPNRKPIASAR